jgi:hypothetical protein
MYWELMSTRLTAKFKIVVIGAKTKLSGRTVKFEYLGATFEGKH